MITPNFYTKEEADSPSYTWRDKKEKKIKIFIFSTTQYSQDKGPECHKHFEKDLDTDVSRDVDIHRMKKEFIGGFPNPEYEVHMEEKINATKESLIAEIEKMNTEKSASLRNYDCFFFMFFTFLASRQQTAGQDMLRLYGKDENISIHEILDKIKTVTYFHGKPKVFLIQADDLSLTQGKLGTKNCARPSKIIERKIPVDADRLIIESRIPQKIRGKGENGSFLVQAFLKVLGANMNGKQDLLSLTTNINREVKELIAKVEPAALRAKLTYPLVTSTLRKSLYL